MTDLNKPPRLWQCKKWTVDLEYVCCVRHPDPGSDDHEWSVFLSTGGDDGIELQDADGKSLHDAWKAYHAHPVRDRL